MTVTLNGGVRELPDGTALVELIEQLGLRPGSVVVEHNGEALPRSAMDGVVLADGDRLELVRCRRRRMTPTEPGGGRGWRTPGSTSAPTPAGAPATWPSSWRRRCAAAWTSSSCGRRGWRRARSWPCWTWSRDAARRHGALWAVNDRADLAATAGADVLHLGQDDLPVPAARRLVGGGPLVGRSTHDVAQVDAADAEPDVDYFCVGPTWPTPTKPGRPAPGLELTRHAAATATRPWFAIGGIDLDRLDEVLAAGARRVVVVRAITGAATRRRRRTGVPGAARDEAPDLPRRAGRLPARHAAAGDRAAHPGVRAVAALAARARPDGGRLRALGPVRDHAAATGRTTSA